MALLMKHIFFKNFLNRDDKNDDLSNYMSPFWFFFYEAKDNILMIIHAKFEVNSCCGWDFRPPILKRYHRVNERKIISTDSFQYLVLLIFWNTRWKSWILVA